MDETVQNLLDVSLSRYKEGTTHYLLVKVNSNNLSQGHKPHLLSTLLEALLREKEHVLLDLSEVQNVSSMFFGCLINAIHLVQEGFGKLKVIVSKELKEPFTTTRITELLEVQDA
jgi:anti-anti-sigma regulatory factor